MVTIKQGSWPHIIETKKSMFSLNQSSNIKEMEVLDT